MQDNDDGAENAKIESTRDAIQRAGHFRAHSAGPTGWVMTLLPKEESIESAIKTTDIAI